MANRFTNTAVAKYDPLTLQEIMMVPMAKQKQHDAFVAQNQETQVLDSQRLSKDDEAVIAELERLKGASSKLADEMLQGGLTRGLKNRFAELRADAQASQTSGILGKAQSAYAKAAANAKAVNDNKNLSQAQKQAGLAWAMNQYSGVANDGVYQDYVGADDMDVQQRAIDLAGEMAPQEIAESAGYTYDPLTKTYSKDGIDRETLPAEHIAQVVLQTMASDEKVMAYLQDAQRIGLIQDPMQYLQNAAISAGNLKAVNNYSEKSKVLTASGARNIKNDSARMNQNGWYTDIQSSGTVVKRLENEYIDPDNEEDFNSKGEWIGHLNAEKELNLMRASGIENSHGARSTGMGFAYYGQTDTSDKAAIANKKFQDLQEFKKNQGWTDVPDKLAVKLMNQLNRSANTMYSTIWANQNLKSTFKINREIILGKDGATGEDEKGNKVQRGGAIMSRRIQNNTTGEVFDNIYDFADDLKMSVNDVLMHLKAGQGPALMPGNSELPMGLVFNMQGRTGDEGINITVANSPEIAQQFGESAKLVDNMKRGIQFQQEKDYEDGKEVYKTYVLDVKTSKDPRTGEPADPSWSPMVITSTVPIKDINEALELSRKQPDDPAYRFENLEQVTISNVLDIQDHYDNISQSAPK